MKARKKQNLIKNNKKRLSREVVMKVVVVMKISSIAACNQIVIKQSSQQTIYVM